MTFSSGTLTGTGDVTVTGPLSWTGGTMSGSGHTRAQGGMTLSGSDYKYLDGRTLDNSGTATWAGSGLIYTYNRAVWNNLPGSTLDAQSDTTFFFSGIGALATFNNQGTFKKSVGSGTTSVEVVFNNSGTLDVQSGTVSLRRGGTSGGAFREAAGATLL